MRLRLISPTSYSAVEMSMTSIKFCAAFAATFALSTGPAMAQSYGPGQAGDSSGYEPPAPPPPPGR
jgi:hypothetical protein